MYKLISGSVIVEHSVRVLRSHALGPLVRLAETELSSASANRASVFFWA